MHVKRCGVRKSQTDTCGYFNTVLSYLKGVRLVPGGPKGVSRALFIPEINSLINFDLYQDFGTVLATVRL